MSERLATHLEVSGLLRRAEALGGTAMVLHRGDQERGGLVILVTDRGALAAVLERSLGTDGRYAWSRTGPADADERRIGEWLAKRRRNDPDLWAIELDIAPSARFIDETISTG